ncbi:GAMYB transcription factor [Trema orientale]|uniref:GAMYB transcription factor n=1 Tax=Trema orientale TaxID=63057 RepID=A0A2P5F1Q1_TREOI|nr:GAMYB transcription factor [Trema orientale]
MDNMLVSESTLAWLWVIEAIASFEEVDPSLLRDAIEAAPELPDDLGKNTKEFVALRCLEGLFASQHELASGVPPAQGLKVGFDLSASCEDVLQRILQETSVSNLRVSASELSRWDIRPFIRHKRACMPKCTLEQLKDAILDGTHPYADFLREKGGLTFPGRDNRSVVNLSNHDSVTARPALTGAGVQSMRVEVNLDHLILENRNKQLGESLHDGDILPSKRGMSGSASKDMAGNVYENCNGKNSSDDQHMNAKRVKQHAPSDNLSIGQNPVHFHGREPLEDSSERDVPVTNGGHDLPEIEMGIMEEGRVLENGCNECTVTKRSRQSNNDGFHKNALDIPCNSPVIPPVISGEEAHQCLSADETNGVGNHCAQSSGAFQSVYQNRVSLHGKEQTEESSERDFQATVEEGSVLVDDCNEGTVSNRSQQSNDEELRKNQSEILYNVPVLLQDTTRDDPHQNLSVDETKDVSEPCAEPSSAPPETVDKISTKESKRSYEHDFQFHEPNPASYDRSRQDITAGEAKVDSNGCGEEMSSDNDGYHNERIDVAKKKHAFLSSQCTVSHDSLIVDWTEQNLCMKCNETGSLLVCSTNNCQLVVHEKCGGSLARFDNKGNFYCPFCAYSLAIMEYLEAKKRSSLANKELAAFICMSSEHQPEESVERLNMEKPLSSGGTANEDILGQNHEEQLGGTEKNEGNQLELKVNEDNDHQCQNVILDGQEVEISALRNNTVNLECTEKREKEGEERIVGECPSARRFEGQENEVPGESDNVAAENTDVVIVNQGKADVGIQQQVLKDQDIDAGKRPVYDNSEGTSETDDYESISNYHIGIRKRENCCTYPATPQTRRKKVPWTLEEEQKLKEGVQKFSDERNIWKKILEFGSNVFMKGRTTVNLKDKWRTMCKVSSKGN